eukprot:4017047-Prymnesium_polylepis.1
MVDADVARQLDALEVEQRRVVHRPVVAQINAHLAALRPGGVDADGLGRRPRRLRRVVHDRCLSHDLAALLLVDPHLRVGCAVVALVPRLDALRCEALQAHAHPRRHQVLVRQGRVGRRR